MAGSWHLWRWFTTEARRAQRDHLAAVLTTSWVRPSKYTGDLDQDFWSLLIRLVYVESWRYVASAVSRRFRYRFTIVGFRWIVGIGWIW
jgi:hypothetical protein